MKYDGYNLAKGGAQYLHLSAPQALAFVRERDNLAEGDIDRTRRQQAVIDYVIWQLKHENAFSRRRHDHRAAQRRQPVPDHRPAPEPARLRHRHAGAERAAPLVHDASVGAGGQRLLPGYGPNPQSVNIISVPYIKRIVHGAFYPPPAAAKAKTTPKQAATIPAASTVTVDVYNGDPNAGGLAGQVSQALVARGYKAGAVKNASAQSRTVGRGNQVFYGAGAAANAAKIATEVGAAASALASLPAGHVEILIGSAVTAVPAGLARPARRPARAQLASAAASATAPMASVLSGRWQAPSPSVGPNAKYGIPCVSLTQGAMAASYLQAECGCYAATGC